jgi:hypothetical protein
MARATTDDPGLHLIVDGRWIAPIDVAEGKYVFLVPSGTAEVRLRSRTAIPSDATPWVADDRRLGVLLRGLTVRSGAERMPVPLDRPDFGSGWWQPEWHDAVTLRRWTDGDAVVPVPLNPEGAWALEVDVAATLPYPVPVVVADPNLVRRSA